MAEATPDRARPRGWWPRGLVALGRRTAVTVVVLAAIVGLWQALVSWRDIPAYLLPPPVEVVRAFTAAPSIFMSNVGVTTTEIVLGLLIGLVGALAWAITFVSIPPVRRALFPVMVAAQSTPKEALAPIFILWWGFSPLPKVVMAAMISFFPMLIATVVGLERFTEQHRLLAASMGAGPLQTLLKFRVWTALPSFLSGMRLGVTLAAIGAVLGEYLGSDRGLGYQILSASRRLNGGLLYASLIALILVTWVLVRVIDVGEGWLLRGARTERYER